jgi:ATP-dependent DNA helicase RecQ
MTAYARADAQDFLTRLAGPTAELRDDQWASLDALVNARRSALLVQATGWGKSAVYFAATEALRRRGLGTTVLISPLLALMRNQVAAAERAGIRAVTVNSTNADDHDQLLGRVAAGEVDVLLVSPERLANPRFAADTLPALLGSTGLLVVDEAHCLSDWGHDFRPDYLRLAALLGELPVGTPVLACTATANARVTGDVATHLLAGRTDEPLVLRGAMARPSLRLAARPMADPVTQIAWLTSALPELPGSGIVYALTVAQAHDVAAHLRSATGLPVSSYTGQTADTDRVALEEALLRNEVKALVATSALGMGFDKPDLGFVVHLGLPSSPVAYYQQVGRAGRGVDDALVVAAPTTADAQIWDYFDSVSFPDEGTVRLLLGALSESEAITVPALERAVDLRRTRLEMVLKVLAVDGAVQRVQGGWLRTGRPWSYDEERYDGLRRARSAERRQMLAYPTADVDCRMRFLTASLDDPAAAACGRCDRCAPGGFVGLLADPGSDRTDTVRVALATAGLELAPKRMWPVGGRISAAQQAEPGRAVGRLTDPVHGALLRQLLDADLDGPLPDQVERLVVATLRGWGWDTRPAAVVAVGSRRHPRLVHALATRIGEIGRLPVLGALTRTGAPPVGGAGNSTHRWQAAQAALALDPDLAARVGALDGPVLLVDDLTDTGWTLTVAAALLRDAGAPAVLPLALASRA